MRLRARFIAAGVLAPALLAAGAPAIAGAAGQAPAGRRVSPPPAARLSVPGVPASGPGARPARSLMDNVLNGVSCGNQPDNPSITSVCDALGFYVDGPYVNGLMEWSVNGKWFPTFSGVAGSYAAANGRWRPYSALWSNGAWSVHVLRGVLGRAHTILQAVSCAAPGSCEAVGDATKPGSTAFAEQYANGAWRAQRVAAGSKSAFYSVSCPTASSCAAVGTHGRRALIQAWNGTSWAGQRAPRTKAPFTTDVLLHISCMTPAICTAVGARHNPKTRYTNKSLALGWNGKSWVIQATVNQ